MSEAEPQIAVLDSDATERPLSHMRLWFGIFLAWVTALALVGNHATTLTTWFGDAGLFVSIVALAALYLSFCNALFPAPTAWTVMLVSSGAFSQPGFNLTEVLAVSLIGGLATTMANLNEYHILSHPIGANLRNKVRRTGVFRWAIKWFDKSPFAALMLIAFIPLPVDAIRWMAILKQYSRKRFALAYWVGRSSRYLLLACLASATALNGWQILGIQVGIVVFSFLAWHIVKTATSSKSQSITCEDV